MLTILIILVAVFVLPALAVLGLAILVHRAAVGAAPEVTAEMLEEEEG